MSENTCARAQTKNRNRNRNRNTITHANINARSRAHAHTHAHTHERNGKHNHTSKHIAAKCVPTRRNTGRNFAAQQSVECSTDISAFLLRFHSHGHHHCQSHTAAAAAAAARQESSHFTNLFCELIAGPNFCRHADTRVHRVTEGGRDRWRD